MYSPNLHNRKDSDELLPVMFWIYGGGFRLGDAYEFGLYDFITFAREQNVVVVAANYRIGALGFLALNELAEEEGAHNSTGNYGLQDQRQALQWVSDNISNFGGDPRKVTLFGESAGAYSVCWHLSHPLSKGLFHAAIMQSGSCSTTSFTRTLEEQAAISGKYIRQFGCSDAACIRSKTLEEVLSPDVSNGLTPQAMINDNFLGIVIDDMIGPVGSHDRFVWKWVPTIDHAVFGTPEHPFTVIKEGRGNYVNVILGNNNDEGNLFVDLLLRNNVTKVRDLTSREDVMSILSHFFSSDDVSSKALDVYAAHHANITNFELASQIIKDSIFQCDVRRTAASLQKHGSSKVFKYQFNYSSPHWIDHALGVYHASELFYLFRNEFPPLVHKYDAVDLDLSLTFSSMWGRFAHFGDPNGDDVATGYRPSSNVMWSTSGDRDTTLCISNDVTSYIDFNQDLCTFWDTIDTDGLFKDKNSLPSVQ